MENQLDQSVSKVEIKGFTAKFYDQLMDIGSLGMYGRFLKSAIKKMNIRPDDAILDLGCGTGRNDCLMAEYLSEKGRIVGVDKGEEMVEQFQKKCGKLPNVSLHTQSILEPLPFENEFDKVVMVFVFHGFTQENRRIIAENAKKALKPGGQFILLDFNEFDFKSKPIWFRVGFKAIECPLAFDFIERDWKAQFKEWGFGDFEEHLWFFDTMRLFKATKKS
ncbi:methyltransferase type 11 [candidate division KSB1 bacterium]|nr:MAG: methyltransferase type 11 [candidate division KSB1 bacterium]